MKRHLQSPGSIVQSGLKRLYLAGFLVSMVVALLAASMLQPLFGTQTHFSVYNTRWNGASGLGSEVGNAGDVALAFSWQGTDEGLQMVHHSFLAFDVDPARSSIVILGPDRSPSAAEIAWLKDFLEQGGRLLLADDFGKGQEFLSGLGIGTEIMGRRLLDLAYLKRPEFIVARDFEDHATTLGLNEVVLNHASAIDVGPGGRVLARTTRSSWLDIIEDGLPSLAEPLGPWPWLVEERLGAGTILILGDPSALTNGNSGLANNALFIRQLAAWLAADGRTVLIDESHRQYPDPVRLRASLVGDVSPVAQAVGASAALLFVAAYATGLLERFGQLLAGRSKAIIARLFPGEKTPTPDLLARAIERHPDWDETVLRRILVGWSEAP